MSHGSDGFAWKGGSTRCTTGIRVFNEFFKVPMQGGNEMIVILMDTQGLFDHQTPEIVNKTLLTLSTLACSVQIFNASKHINAHHLQYLKTCVDFAMATAKADKGDRYLKLQRLMFLVRDFPEEDDGAEDSSCYGLKYGEKYLGTILDSKEGGSKQMEIRAHIKESFEDVRCFPMPHPGLKVEKKNFTGKNSDLEEDFLTSVKEFVEEVASPDKLVPKRTTEKHLRARELLNMITACDTNFGRKIFEASNMMEANEKAYYAAEYEDAKAEYTKLMKSCLDGFKEMTEKEFETKHNETKNHALKRYESALPMGIGEYKIRYRDHLMEKCEEDFKLYKERFTVRMRKFRQSKISRAQRAYVEYETAMQNGSSSGLEDEEFEKFHQQQFDEIRQKYAEKVDMGELEKKVNAGYQKLFEANKKYRDERKKAMEEDRRGSLYKLANVTLRLKCAEKWRKELEVYPDDDDMEKARVRIKAEMEEEYWKNALTPTEAKYRKILENKLKYEFARLTKQAGNEQVVIHKNEMQQLKTPENELLYHARVDEIVGSFQVDLTNNMKQEGASMLCDTQSVHKRMFFNFCSEHLIFYLGWLRDDVTKNAFEDAGSRNKENWKQLDVDMENAITGLILEQEMELQEIMSDRHINEGDLEKYFSNAETKMKEGAPGDLAKVLKKSQHAKKKYDNKVESMMKESLEKMRKKNKENMEKRNVIDSADVPETDGVFKRAWRWIKGKFGVD